MLEQVKQALRIDGTLFDDELNELISACKMDLETSGAEIVNEEDPLISRAIIFYCKSYFGYPDKYLIKSYEALRDHIALCGEYKEMKV